MSNSDEINSFVKSFVFWTTLVIISAYIMFSCIKAVYGYDPEMNSYQSLSTQLTSSRSLFVSKQESIQNVAAQLIDEKEGFAVYRALDGTPFVEKNGVSVPMSETDISEELVSYFEELYTAVKGSDDEEEGTEYRIMLTVVRPYGLEFYTGYSVENGFSGILYEFQSGVHGDYTVIELVENWQLFFEDKKADV